MNSTSPCSLAGRYDNPIPPRFLAPIDCLKIPALVLRGIKKGTVEGVIVMTWISNVAGFKNVAGVADIYYSKQCNMEKLTGMFICIISRAGYK
jgi:hypothetical protein